MIFITSCQTGINQKLVCKQIKKSTPKAAPHYSISFYHNRCRVRCFSLITSKTVSDLSCGKLFKSGDYPIEDCDGISGFKDGEWAVNHRPKIRKLNNLFFNLCK